MRLTAALVASLVVQAEDGVPLFNGKDLAGWVQVNCSTGTFTAKDGMIVCTGIPTGVLRTDRMYENYILELEWKHLKEGGNAGLFVHSAGLPVRGQPFTKSIEVQIMLGDHPQGHYTRHGDVFAIQGATFVPDRPHPKGSMRCLPSENRVKPAGEWNHYRVECRDGKIDLAVNGKVVSGGSKCNPRKGYICLESEGSEVHFRNIRIKELPPSNPPAVEVADADLGFVPLYTGVDLGGWKAVPGWTSKDWILSCDGKTETQPLWTEKDFGDFIFIADWKPLGKAATNQVPIYPRGIGVGLSDFKPKAGQWHRIFITLIANKLTITVDGKTLDENEATPGGALRGRIGLRNHGEPAQFANLYIKEMK